MRLLPVAAKLVWFAVAAEQETTVWPESEQVLSLRQHG